MTFFPDMGTESMMDSGEPIRAIGWLHRDHPYPQRTVSQDFLDRLREFTHLWGKSSDALDWAAAGGVHSYEFCGKCHLSGNFGVPAGDLLFVAPEMIAHYVEKHSYHPPAEFVAAVLAAPLPGTQEHKAAVANILRQRRIKRLEGLQAGVIQAQDFILDSYCPPNGRVNLRLTHLPTGCRWLVTDCDLVGNC